MVRSEQDKSRKLQKLTENLFREYTQLESGYGKEIQGLEKHLQIKQQEINAAKQQVKFKNEQTGTMKANYEGLLVEKQHKIDAMEAERVGG